jgi:hypothetical protein
MGVDYLNGLSVDKITRLEVLKDLTCHKCGKLFQEGEQALSFRNRINSPKRHVICAFRLGLITREDLNRLERLKNLIFAGLMTGWLMIMAQYYVVING